MKKVLALLIALVMMCAAGAAFAETAGTPDLYDLYSAADGGKLWIGTAIPIMDGVAITSPIGLPEKLTALEIWDGTAYREVSVTMATADGKVLVVLHETDGEKPGIPAYDFLETGTALQAGDMMVRSGDWMRSRVNRAVYDSSVISWNNREAMLLTLSGDTTLGAPVVAADGKLVGMVTAEYAEGVNRYVALTVTEITRSLQEAVGMLDGMVKEDRLAGYTVTVEGNLVTFDWSGVTLPEVAEGEKLYHIVADTENSYLTYAEVSEDFTSTTMILTPGRTYVSGLAGFAGIPDELPEQTAVTVLPEAQPMTDFGFRSITFAIAEMPQDAPDGTMPTPVTEVSEELLRSGRACVYSVSSYQVDRQMADYTLLVTLTAPDGDNYRYESGWYYDPSIMDWDEWFTAMGETGLLEMLDESGYPEGTYVMDMYIDGKLADSFSFTLTR